MTAAPELHEDLAYVAQAVRRNERDPGYASIYWLWAVITPIGFALTDFAAPLSGLYWLFAGPVGGTLSAWLAVRADRRRGERNRAAGQREGLHWLVMLPAFVLTALPMLTGAIAWPAGQSYFLLVTGIAYALAGVHLQRPMLWIGLLMMAAYAGLVLYNPPYTWTITGVLVGLSLAAAGWFTARRA